MLFLRRIGEHDERNPGRRAMHEMHGVERIAHAEFEVEQNNFGVDDFCGGNERGHRRDDGEVEAAGRVGKKRAQSVGSFARFGFREQDA